MRLQHDHYPTDERLVEELMDILHIAGIQNLGYVLEPCAGAGDIARALAPHARKIVTNDLVHKTADLNMDASKPRFWVNIARPDWVVTNPPYESEILNEILARSLTYSTLGTIMLLRLSFLEPTTKVNPRETLLRGWNDNLRFVIPISGPRPSYTQDGKTDSVTTGWFVWDHSWSWSARGILSPFQFITNWR